MDKHLKTQDQLHDKPIDELSDLDSQMEDLMFAAEHAASQRQRFALVVDATSSMGSVWSKAKDALKTAVDEIKRSAVVPVQICVVAYRDHIEDHKKYVVEASEWSDDTDYLYDYIREMRCHGGGDYPESIGHGLAYIQQQQQAVHQIILIGDAPSKKDSFGYAEAQAFGQQNCPIYALYTDKDPHLVKCFQKLARLSGGKAFHLDKASNMSDVFQVLLSSNKTLGIEYQPATEEGRRIKLEVSH